MNSIDDLVALRPDVEPLTSVRADELWLRAVGRDTELPAGEPGGRDGALRDLDVDHSIEAAVDPSPLPRRRWAMIGAAAAIIVGLAAMALLASPRTDDATSTAERGGSVADALAAISDVPPTDRIPEPPMLDLATDGWTLTAYTDDVGPALPDPESFSVMVPTGSLDRWISFSVVPAPIPTTTIAAVGEAPADPANQYLSRTVTAGDGTTVFAEGFGYDDATFVDLVDTVLRDGEAPESQEVLSPDEAAQFHRFVQYEFSSDDTARRLHVTVLPGSGSRLPVTLPPGEVFQLLPTAPDGTRMAAARRGFWGISVEATGFGSDSDVQAVLDTLTEIDRATFEAEIATVASVPAASVPAAELPGSVAPTTTTSLPPLSTTSPLAADAPRGPRASLELPGWVLSAADAGDDVTIGAEYRYTAADGRNLQVNFYPGTLADRVANEFPADAVDILSESQQVATYPDGRRFRYDAALSDLTPGGGDWVMEVDGEPFANQDDFMAVVRAVTFS